MGSKVLYRVTAGLALAIGLGALADAIAVRLGLTTSHLPGFGGPLLWATTRAAGVTAFVALTLDVLFGLFVSTRAAERWIPRARSVELHQWLSAVALALTGLHVVVLLGDRFVRFDLVSTLVPFLSSYRPLAVALGIVAGYVALAVHLSFGLRARLGPRTWRRLHYLSFAAYAGALAHGVLAGSDTHSPGMQTLYFVSGGLVVLLTLHRFIVPRARPAGARDHEPLTPGAPQG